MNSALSPKAMNWRHLAGLSRAIPIALLALGAGCGPIDDASTDDDGLGDQDIASAESPLVGKSGSYWNQNTVVHICWKTPGFSKEKEWVRESIRDSWQSVTTLSFDNWGDCPPLVDPFWGPVQSYIAIRVSDERPHTTALGRKLASTSEEMVLNFAFQQWDGMFHPCTVSEADRERCIRASAVHEFGHGMAFGHEQDRPDTPQSCRDSLKDDPSAFGTPFDQLLTATYDEQSVMNYCNPIWNNSTVPTGFLSAGDVEGARSRYGLRGDTRLAAIPVTLAPSGTETVIHGSTVRANHEINGPVGCSVDADVWYKFVLPQDEMVYIDTSVSGWDTSLYVTDNAGNPIPGMANDDAHCGSSPAWTSNYESAVFGKLAPGTYYVSVGGCGRGNFLLRFQHMPKGMLGFDVGQIPGNDMSTALNQGVTATTVLTYTSKGSRTCGVSGGGGTGSGEDVRWFVSCGGRPMNFSLCSQEGGTFTRAKPGDPRLFDPVMYTWSGLLNGDNPVAGACVDDAFACPGTGGDSASVGARIQFALTQRGLGAIVVDDRGNDGNPPVVGGGMSYAMAYDLH